MINKLFSKYKKITKFSNLNYKLFKNIYLKLHKKLRIQIHFNNQKKKLVTFIHNIHSYKY